MRERTPVSPEEKTDEVNGTEMRRKEMKKIIQSLSLEKCFLRYKRCLNTLKKLRETKLRKTKLRKTKVMDSVKLKLKKLDSRLHPYTLNFVLRLQNKLSAVNLSQIGGEDVPRPYSETVLRAVNSLLELMKKEENFLSNGDKAIYIQFTSVKIPITGRRPFWITLPHTVLPESPDVCMITRDVRAHRKLKDFENSAEYYRKHLRKCGVTGISEIITLRQLKREYELFEMKRALFSRFDFFLVDRLIRNHAAQHLGRDINKKKPAVPVSLPRRNLKNRINAALRTTCFQLTPTGNTFSFKVGHTNLGAAKLCANIVAASKALRRCFPGGWDNILSLSIKSFNSVALPLHVSTGLDFKIPVEKPSGFKNEFVFGKLDHNSVQVSASGKVTVHKNIKKVKTVAKNLRRFGNEVVVDFDGEEIEGVFNEEEDEEEFNEVENEEELDEEENEGESDEEEMSESENEGE